MGTTTLGLIGADGGIGSAVSYLAEQLNWIVEPCLTRLDCQDTRMARSVAEDLGNWLRRVRPAALVHAAGVNRLSWSGTTQASDFFETFTVNLWSCYELINQAMRYSLGPMRVVFLGSEAGRVPMRCSSYYCASKAALHHMTKVLARELAPSGWRINCVAPGVVVGTQMTREVYAQVGRLRGWDPAKLTSIMTEMIPQGRFCEPAEVAQMVMFLLSDQATYINGETVSVTGGK